MRGYNNGQQGYPPSSYQQPGGNQQQQQQLQQPNSLLNGNHQPQQTGGQNQQGQQQKSAGQSQQSGDDHSQAASGPGAEMNLASVLHYLQSEWRRWERDRNEWEIERAEMRARIALLEGQRRSAENLKVDLLRRVKMLEFALRQERTKAGGTTGKGTGVPPSRITALQDEDRLSQKDEKEGSGSEGSENGDRPKVNGTGAQFDHAKSSTIASRSFDTSSWKNIGTGGVPRDPKARARSKEYLKQCLQEITYLTSPGALNPLPPRPPISLNDPISPRGDPYDAVQQDANGGSSFDRPKKALPKDPLPVVLPKSDSQPEKPSDANLSIPNGDKEDRNPGQSPMNPVSHAMSVDVTARPPSSPAQKSVALPPTDSNETNQSGQILTAIYRPESKAAWREELRAANEKAQKIREQRPRSEDFSSDEDPSASLSTHADEVKAKLEETSPNESLWTTRRSLKSHMDIVRSVAFAHAPGVVLASGGDDSTVKVWSLDPSALRARKHTASDLEPIMTYRGHTAAVTTVVVSPPSFSSDSQIFSASLDSTIRVWKVPPSDQDPYGEFNADMMVQTVEGHTDAVWDLACLAKPHSRTHGGHDYLCSASADGSVKTWVYDNGRWTLKDNYTFDDATPTCLTPTEYHDQTVYIGLSNGRVELWDVKTGQKIRQWDDDLRGGQVNAILCHPFSPVIIAGHEDGHLRFYEADKSSTEPTHKILAHPAPITALAVSPRTSTSIFSASADCSIRLWDLATKTSVQDLAGHRKKSDEGVCALARHPSQPIVASAGADGVVRVWLTS